MTKRSKAGRCQRRDRISFSLVLIGRQFAMRFSSNFKQYIIEGTEKFLQTNAKKPDAQWNEIMITRDNNEETCTVSTAASSNN